MKKQTYDLYRKTLHAEIMYNRQLAERLKKYPKTYKLLTDKNKELRGELRSLNEERDAYEQEQVARAEVRRAERG